MGFTMSPEEAQTLIEKDVKNKDVLFPFLNGQDLNSNFDQSPSRWVINFKDYPLDAEHDDPKKPKGKPYAADYPDCLKIVEEKVKPERTRLNEKGEFVLRKPIPQKWWIYAEKRPALYKAIANLKRVLFHAFNGKYMCFGFVPSNIVFAAPHVVIALSSNADFAKLQSGIHETWVLNYCSTLRHDIRYAPSDVFETFPFPESTANLETIGEKYYNHRQNIMLARQSGLTKTYNRFHNPDETATDIQQLRELHVEMDRAVAAAYNWSNLDLEHGFHDTKQGLRFTISETARREVLDRLLQLNHQRYKEEVAQGLHNKKKGKGKKKAEVKKSDDGNGQLNLFENL